MNSETRSCQNCKNQFTIEPADFSFYEKMQVPAPTWCPECRMIRRFIWRNERAFFRNTDQISKKEVLSGISPKSQYKIYDRDYWYSDDWDPMSYGRDYDFSRSFFEQFYELMKEIPWPARSARRLVNSDYSNNGADLKNAYLCFNASNVENSAYVVSANTVKESLDLYSARHTELAYDNYMVDESYRVFFSVNVEDSHEVWFSRNLIGCQNCFGCVNLRNKSYYIFNKPHSRESYMEFMQKFYSGSVKETKAMRGKAHVLWSKNPMRFTLAINSSNVSGEHIEHSTNVHQSYAIHEAKDLKYCQDLENTTDSYDHTIWGNNASLIYESCVVGRDVSKVKFSYSCYDGTTDTEYSAWCGASTNLFGCFGLKKKQYCILNKQYTKEEYEKLKAKIIEQMKTISYTDSRGKVYRYGEFFPHDFSPFAYNETIAQDFFPLTKEATTQNGFLFREPEIREYKATINGNDVADDIKDVKDDILKEIISCTDCGKPYRIIQMEFEFYRRIPLPIPRFCPECRFQHRFNFVNPPKLWKGKCHCGGTKDEKEMYDNGASHFHGENHCPNEFQTSYNPNRPEIVYCEQCYQAEVI